MAGFKTNEREGTRAVLRHARLSPYKVREVLDLVRGKPVHEAEDILRFSERDAAFVVGKVLHSAVANAENNDEREPEELFVSACFADEGTTIKRWRPRARGRATRIRKRTSHITVIVSRMPEQQLQRLQARRRAEQLAQRARRVAGARRAEGDQRSRAERRHGGPVADELEAAETEAPETEALETEAPETEAPATETAVGEAAKDEAAPSETADAGEAESEAPEAEGAELEATTTEAEEPSAQKEEPGDDMKDEH
jgi:large subunit ribosomal protein L22